MRLDHLRSFAGVARAGTFRKAANDLCIGQPALSRKIQALEYELGVDLFIRSPVGASLTPAGEFLFARTNSILADFSRLKSEMGAFRRDEKKRKSDQPVAFGTTYALAQVIFPAIAGLLRDEHRGRIPVKFCEQTTSELYANVASGQLDMVIVGGIPVTEGLNATWVYDDPLCLVSPAGTRRSKTATISAKEAARLPLIVYAEGHGPRSAMDDVFRAVGVEPQIILEAGGLATILSHVRHEFGHGIAPLSSMLATDSHSSFDVTPVEGLYISRNLVSRRRADDDATLQVIADMAIAETRDFLGNDERFAYPVSSTVAEEEFAACKSCSNFGRCHALKTGLHGRYPSRVPANGGCGGLGARS